VSTIVSQLVTAIEFHDLVMRPENLNRYLELDRGDVVEMPPPRKYHGFVCGNVSRILGNFSAETGIGYVRSNDSGFIVEQDPDTIRGPDVTVYLDADTSESMTRGYADSPPVLAVKVLSPSDRVVNTLHRLDQMLARGVKIVWLIDFENREVSIHQTGKRFQRAGEKDTITGETVLPGLEVAVADLFRMPGDNRAT